MDQSTYGQKFFDWRWHAGRRQFSQETPLAWHATIYMQGGGPEICLTNELFLSSILVNKNLGGNLTHTPAFTACFLLDVLELVDSALQGDPALQPPTCTPAFLARQLEVQSKQCRLCSLHTCICIYTASHCRVVTAYVICCWTCFILYQCTYTY